MIDGVTILAETTCAQINETVFVISILIFFLSILITGMIYIGTMDAKPLLINVIVCILIVSCHLYGYLSRSFGFVEYKQYQVTISEDVKFKDFYDKYMIINQEGEIFTIREREE